MFKVVRRYKYIFFSLNGANIYTFPLSGLDGCGVNNTVVKSASEVDSKATK